jgi:hypothetical protein
MTPTGGLRQFRDEVHPDALADVLALERDAELGRLLAKLRSHTERKAFFDSWAEALLARHMLAHGCALKFEVPTPHDRRADFEVTRDGVTFCLHLKRLDSDRPPHEVRRHLRISSRLRMLERVRRPYIVQVRWHDGLSDDQMQLLVQQAEEFILHGHVGDEMRAKDHDGRDIGGVRIIAPNIGGGDTEHVSVTIGLPTGFIDLSPRMRRLLNRAHEQFMPKAVNVIVLSSNHDEDVNDFESALLGSHIERWDQFPPRGQRIAHGRAPDGFWHGRGFADSAYAAWMKFSPKEQRFRSRLYMRDSMPPEEQVTRLLKSLFDDAATQ